jgi:hypothetical protein
MNFYEEVQGWLTEEKGTFIYSIDSKLFDKLKESKKAKATTKNGEEMLRFKSSDFPETTFFLCKNSSAKGCEGKAFSDLILSINHSIKGSVSEDFLNEGDYEKELADDFGDQRKRVLEKIAEMFKDDSELVKTLGKNFPDVSKHIKGLKIEAEKALSRMNKT